MGVCMDIKPKNCNHCIYRENVSRYLDLEDYCIRNMKHTSKINMETDCPLRESKAQSKVRNYFEKIVDNHLVVSEIIASNRNKL